MKIAKPTDINWEPVEIGYSGKSTNEHQIQILLRVGHGLPGNWDNVAGCAEINIKKPGNPAINERLYFSDHPDYIGEITGEFYESNGVIENVGETWPIDYIDLKNPESMDDGDETNDDAMKAFVEKYISQINFKDELAAAQAENMI